MRTRYRAQTATNYCTVSGQSTVMNYANSSSPWPFLDYERTWGVNRSACASSIIDESTPLDHQLAKACTHVSMNAISFQPQFSVAGSDGSVSSVRMDMTIRAPEAQQRSALVDWDGLVLSLSDRIDRRLAARSLAAVSLYELRKTVKMIRNPFSLLNPRVRKEMFRTPKALMKAFPNFWLEHRYGWKPLLADITGFSEALGTYMGLADYKKFKEDPDTRYSVRSSSGMSKRSPTMTDAIWNSYVTNPGFSTYEGGVYRYVGTDAVYSATVSCHAANIREQCISRFDNLLNSLGCSPRELPLLLWEVVPFSFVFDWFLNTNVVLQALPNYEARVRLREKCSRLCYSTKFSEVGYLEYAPGRNWVSTPAIGGGRGVPITPLSFRSPAVTATRYNRVVGLPPGTSLLKSGVLSQVQGISGLCLILQQLKPRK